MKQAWWVIVTVLVCTSMTLFTAAAPDDAPKKETPPAQENPPPVNTPQTTETDQLRERVLSAADGGKLTDDLVTLFGSYALALAREKLSTEVPADFWTWLDANRPLRDALLVALHPDYPPAVVRCLQELREKFGDKTDSHSHLALAFAVVFGRAGDDVPWRPYLDYLRRDRKPPTMEQSFRYYLKFEKSMKLSLTGTPWPLLVHVVDNETPLDERLWVLEEFGRQVGGSVYYKVPYDWDKLTGTADIGDRPRSLPNLRKYGGICGDRAYFASRVYKSLGIPGVSVSGEGRRGGHAWVAWVGQGQKGKAYTFEDAGRFDYDRYYTGTTWDPVLRQEILDRDVELLTAAVGVSYGEYLKVLVGCHVYEMSQPEARKTRTALLKDSIEHDPFVARAWRLLGDACVTGDITPREGEKVFDSIFKALEAYPDLTFEVLAKVLSARLKAEGEPDKEEVDRNLLVLNRAFALYEKGERPDLAVNLCLLRGDYLEALKREKDALKLYVTASEAYATQHFGFRELFDRALRMLSGDEALRKRLAFCEIMVKKVPRQRSSFDKKLNQLNPSYVYVVRAYVRALYAAGLDRQAQQWEARIQPKD